MFSAFYYQMLIDAKKSKEYQIYLKCKNMRFETIGWSKIIKGAKLDIISYHSLLLIHLTAVIAHDQISDKKYIFYGNNIGNRILSWREGKLCYKNYTGFQSFKNLVFYSFLKL